MSITPLQQPVVRWSSPAEILVSYEAFCLTGVMPITDVVDTNESQEVTVKEAA